jgi:hypothetical protein
LLPNNRNFGKVLLYTLKIIICPITILQQYKLNVRNIDPIELNPILPFIHYVHEQLITLIICILFKIKPRCANNNETELQIILKQLFIHFLFWIRNVLHLIFLPFDNIRFPLALTILRILKLTDLTSIIAIIWLIAILIIFVW